MRERSTPDVMGRSYAAAATSGGDRVTGGRYVRHVETGTKLAEVVAALPGGGEVRDGQARMAGGVAAAIESGRHLIVQAGTGTGKSLAYLVPIVLSGKTAVISTATKALQDQLAGKDLPFLATHLGQPFTFAVLKGRSNYLCLQKAREIGEQDEQSLDLGLDLDDLSKRDRDELARILRWAMRSPSGDRADLPFEPSARTWGAVSVATEECPGAARCPMGEHCFADRALHQAGEADVIVVNTHLYGVHMATGGFLLPEHDVVVFDEAHELEDITAATLGLTLGAGRFRALARTVRGVLADADLPGQVDDAGSLVERALLPHRGARLDAHALASLGEPFAAARQRIDRALDAVRAAKPEEGTRAAARRERALRSGGGLAADLDLALRADDDRVEWVEGPDHAPVLKVAPIVVAELLADGVWSKHTCVLTSATIPPRLATRVGLPDEEHDAMDAGSPFDHREQALLYVPRHLPAPRDPRWEDAALEELEALVRLAGGRTLALFTSWRMMDAARERLAGAALPWTVLTQRDLPKPALINAFTQDETSCLLATMGFWQGVDVPGRSLSLVVIDRIPFPRPDEPLTAARRERAGEAAFAEVDLPRAATLLAQGAGRLIRSTTDRGVVAVLDSRLARADYRHVLLSPVPPMRRTVVRDDVAAFLAETLAS
jgi:ATP-dependent DNA helicase DinG